MKLIEFSDTHFDLNDVNTLQNTNNRLTSVPADLYVEKQDESIEKYLEVFKNIFAYHNHEGHYNMMTEDVCIRN